MKTKLVKMFIGFAALMMILTFADASNAQRRREARGKKISKTQVNTIINRVEDRVDNFVKHFDKSLDKSRLDGTNREDWLNKRAGDLERATDELSREFQRRDTWMENMDEVRKCLNIATDIDKNMKTRRYSRDAETIWAKVRFELNTLADAYNLPKISSRAY